MLQRQRAFSFYLVLYSCLILLKIVDLNKICKYFKTSFFIRGMFERHVNSTDREMNGEWERIWKAAALA
jgi:hypothetical protein